MKYVIYLLGILGREETGVLLVGFRSLASYGDVKQGSEKTGSKEVKRRRR